MQKLRIGVSALIVHNNKILLIRREKKPFFNRWTLPGGHLEEGESYSQAIQREIMEEVGLSISCSDRTLLFPMEKQKFLIVTKLCTLVSDKQIEHEQIKNKFMELSDFNQLRPRQCTPYLQQIVNILLTDK